MVTRFILINSVILNSDTTALIKAQKGIQTKGAQHCIIFEWVKGKNVLYL